MSTVHCNTVQTSSGGPVTLTKQSAAKAWINLNGTGTIAQRDALNISGIVDGGTGLYDISISAAMANDDYAAVAGGSFDDSASSSISGCFSCRSLTTSSLRITCAGTANNVLDMLTVTMSIHGDLA